MTTLVVDNYDSFTWNLVQLVGALGGEPIVRRNDEMTLDDVPALSPWHSIFSPGPGDTIGGLAGNDTIAGGDGDDRIFAGADNDSVAGEARRPTPGGGANEPNSPIPFGETFFSPNRAQKKKSPIPPICPTTAPHPPPTRVPREDPPQASPRTQCGGQKECPRRIRAHEKTAL